MAARMGVRDKMKILAICGSPRKGNTEFMLNIMLKDRNDSEIVLLRELKIKNCIGDDSCMKTKECHIKDDDANEIYKKMEEADTIILASPSYFSNVTGIMKNFMDRGNPYWLNEKLKGKKAFLLGVGGQEGTEGNNVIECMKFFARGLHMEITGEYFTTAEKPKDLENNEKVIKELQKIGEKL